MAILGAKRQYWKDTAADLLNFNDPEVSYTANFGPKNDDIGAENCYFWNSIINISVC
jgi:hypothetical protein